MVKLYLVYHPANKKEMKELWEKKHYYILGSYYYLKQEKDLFFLGNQKYFMLDSGAFSAYTTNTWIDIYQYIDFIKRNNIKIYFNLDLIDNFEKTWENQKIMEDEGLYPIPVFHYGEDFKFLEEMVKKYDYIALGGMVQLKNKKKLSFWLKKCFSKIPKNIKVHGLAISSLDLIKKFRFYSTDSSSWASGARYGLFFYFKRNQILQKNYSIKNTTSNNSILNKWNLIQWLKYQRYLEGVKNEN